MGDGHRVLPSHPGAFLLGQQRARAAGRPARHLQRRRDCSRVVGAGAAAAQSHRASALRALRGSRRRAAARQLQRRFFCAYVGRSGRGRRRGGGSRACRAGARGGGSAGRPPRYGRRRPERAVVVRRGRAGYGAGHAGGEQSGDGAAARGRRPPGGSLAPADLCVEPRDGGADGCAAGAPGHGTLHGHAAGWAPSERLCRRGYAAVGCGFGRVLPDAQGTSQPPQRPQLLARSHCPLCGSAAWLGARWRPRSGEWCQR
mmetsp:Transcript_15004/g.38892  ORF Transcript_15004/g.38892 Transcript_15004/m.38892 type:complete len:258 (+) Transcript_15004:815-1588(+)